ncbi:DUF2388 domain-containing protein [Stutzerimonas azotifigens]|uniref:DUF2388 domain-containing protein n=1 Tax=Stutzerimonas azotifigens TaxID=291995 RepID=UPI0003FD271A|nr:DUF2388 domain-containing protein [Stutzerimonas azotifigens]
MRILLPLLAGVTFAGSAHAFDVTTGGLVRTSYISSQLTSAPFDNKLIGQARDDAALFVGSDGALRGAHLEAALRWLRTHEALAASDLELARAILVQ